jgi:hypothetical protein
MTLIMRLSLNLPQSLTQCNYLSKKRQVGTLERIDREWGMVRGGCQGLERTRVMR